MALLTPAPTLRDRVRRFRDLHDRAKKGALGAHDLGEYFSERAALTAALLDAQSVTRPPGHAVRRHLRTSRPLPAEIELHAGRVCALTSSLSAGGFGASLELPTRVGEYAKVTVRLPDGESLHARARVVGAREEDGRTQADFAFVGDGAVIERIERFVLDAVLSELAG